MKAAKLWFWRKTATDLCMRFKKLDWRTQDAERMVMILLKGR